MMVMYKLKSIIWSFLLCLGGTVVARTAEPLSVGYWLEEIERNNTALQAVRDAGEAARMENRTGLNLENPEVEFHYLWDTYGRGEVRKDFSVMQSFDWATLTGTKRRVMRTQDSLTELDYRAQRNALRLKAKQLLVELTAVNALMNELQERDRRAVRLVEGVEEQCRLGRCTALDASKARLEQTRARTALLQAEAERRRLSAALQTLNGGRPVEYTAMVYEPEEVPGDFEQWYAGAEERNPMLHYIRTEVELSRKQLKMTRAEVMPSLSVGYMTERGPTEGFQGLAVGLSVPLWENRNRVKQRKAAVVAAESKAADARMQFYGNLNELYIRVQTLKQLAEGYRTGMQTADARQLLYEALAAGRLTVTDYVTELSQYDGIIDEALSAERDYRLALAELKAFEW